MPEPKDPKLPPEPVPTHIRSDLDLEVSSDDGSEAPPYVTPARPGAARIDVRSASTHPAGSRGSSASTRATDPGAAPRTISGPFQTNKPVVQSNVSSRPVQTQRPKQRPRPAPFVPREPRSWEEAGVDAVNAEQLILRYLLLQPKALGKQIAESVALAFPLANTILLALKAENTVKHIGSNAVGDFIYELTVAGREKALNARKLTSYVGPAPVTWQQYLASVEQQALRHYTLGPEHLSNAFSDLSMNEDLLERLGPAMSSARSVFLFGEPGNGKTSIAERMTRCYGEPVWIPHTIDLGGMLLKVFDPAIHREVPGPENQDSKERLDKRWVRIHRPTVVAGGELTLDMLEVQHDASTNVCEAPLQLKANLGTLLVDDFGRGKTAPKDILNRWIYPLERRVDFLRMPDGRKHATPFECLLVFSTNLEPRALADEAFLRRIPYKVYVGDPDEAEFTALVEKLAQHMGVQLTRGSVKYLIDRHYKLNKRPMRFCHPRDLLHQVLHLAEFLGTEPICGPEQWDRVCTNYFGVS